MPDEAGSAYTTARDLYMENPNAVPLTLYSEANQKLYEADNPLANTYQEAGDESGFDFLPIAIGGIVFVGIGLTIFYLRR